MNLHRIYKSRPKWSKKGDFGRLLVVGGSHEYSGAPAIASLAAYRAGCDIVITAVPEIIAHTVRLYSPDLIVYPLKGKYLGKKHVKEIMALQKKNTAMVIGNGLSRKKSVLPAVRDILKKTKIPTVVDADALHAVAKKEVKKNFLLTPHAHEFFVLSGKKVGNSVTERKRAVQSLSRKLGCITLLKGHVDVISNGKKIAVNRSGNPYMTKGGTGDVLAGVCGALLAREIDPFTAAQAGAYITGKAGDLAAREKKEGLMATDVVGKTSQVIKERR